MNRTRFSLFYVAGFLTFAGIFMLVDPRTATQLLLSNTDYGDIMPRLAGGLLVGLAMIVVQIIRFRAESLYTTTIAVRIVFCLIFIWLYAIGHDPMFLILLAVVGLGVIMSAMSYFFDKR
ncbi:MAG: hypothetical protein HW412_2195 [Bacteroidetes bacterium]|nr:hypothetical protein [Bacteroidota bacterium]